MLKETDRKLRIKTTRFRSKTAARMEITPADFFEYLKTGKGKLLTYPKLPLTFDIPELVNTYVTTYTATKEESLLKETFAYNLWQVIKDLPHVILERIYATLGKYSTVLSYTSRLICLELLEASLSKDQQTSYLDLLNQIVVTNSNALDFIGTRTHIVAGASYVVDMLTYNKNLKGSLMDKLLDYPNIRLVLTHPTNNSSLISNCYLSELGVLTNLKKSVLPKSCHWLECLKHEYTTPGNSRSKISTLTSQINLFGSAAPDIKAINTLLKTSSLSALDQALKLEWIKSITTKYRTYLLKLLHPLFQNNLTFLISYITYHIERPSYAFPQYAELLNHISDLYQKQLPQINTAHLPGKETEHLFCDLILTGIKGRTPYYASPHLKVSKFSPELRVSMLTLLYHLLPDRDLTLSLTELIKSTPAEAIFSSLGVALKSTPLRASLIAELGAETNYHTSTLLLTEHMLAGGVI